MTIAPTTPSDSARDVRAFAFYLPQFHPIPENDRWWGPGFTEWHNVARAEPQFRGHQLLRPADLGYYDLRVPEIAEQQAGLARTAGLAGFCYYHYWFSGRRVLQRPFDHALASGRPDFGFMLCWANEPWTRAWDGATGEVLIEQQYSHADDLAHIRHLCEAFADPRYARIDGKPALLVYRASQLPDAARTVDTWRGEAQRLGLGDLHLARVECHRDEQTDPVALGFDAAVEFQPDWKRLRGLQLRQRGRHKCARALGVSSDAFSRHRVFDYSDVVETMLNPPMPAYRRHRGVTPRWDNTARRGARGGAVILHRSTPELYRRWLAAVVEHERDSDDPVVFINSWNEWGEGAPLEPDHLWGRAYLDATADVLVGVRRMGR